MEEEKGVYRLLQMRQEKWGRGLEMHRNVQKMYIYVHLRTLFEPPCSGAHRKTF